jgi:hypothetical protein
MDDKELIKRIMEEVKDEKLREELLRRVVKEEGKGVEKILKRIEHRLKAEDSLAKQKIMRGRTEKLAKLEWWGELIATPLFSVFFYGFAIGLLILFHYDGSSIKMSKFTWFLLGLLVLAGIAQIVRDVYFLLEGKKEYERRKREEKELEK